MLGTGRPIDKQSRRYQRGLAERDGFPTMRELHKRAIEYVCFRPGSHGGIDNLIFTLAEEPPGYICYYTSDVPMAGSYVIFPSAGDVLRVHAKADLSIEKIEGNKAIVAQTAGMNAVIERIDISRDYKMAKIVLSINGVVK